MTGRGRVAALDGVRGIAILLVVVMHADVAVAEFGGVVGVTLFFVLSGYLITGILQREWTRTGRIDFVDFYKRRARRLLPALVLACVGYIVLAGIIGESMQPVFEAVGTVLLYVANIAAVLPDWSNGWMGHAWTLSMEEQFYLVWPLLLLLLLRRGRRAALVLIAALIAMSLASKGITGFETREAYRTNAYSPWTNAWALLLGAGLALHAAGGDRSRTAPRWAAGAGLAGIVLLSGPFGLVSVLGSGALADYGARILASVLAGGAAALLLWGLPVAERLQERLSHPTLVWFGTISYGLYLWHKLLDAFIQAAVPGVSETVSGVLGSLIAVPVAAASFYAIERPIMQYGWQVLLPAAHREQPDPNAPVVDEATAWGGALMPIR